MADAEPHGGPDAAELAALGLRPEDVLDFSASTNPCGPPPGVREALAACDITRYPDRAAAPLRQALAEREGVTGDRVLIGNGAAGLIWALTLAWLPPGATAFIIGPTFGEYAAASRLLHAHVCEWRSSPTADFVPDLLALARAIAASRPQLIWLCNPNNPTGVYLPAEAIAALLPAAPDALWVLDEAYRPFVAAPWDSRPLIEDGQVVLLRSLTKDCALPGVRLGYLLAAPAVIRRCAAAQPPWSVSAPAITAGVAALHNYGAVRASLAALRAETVWLRGALREQGWRVPPAAANFLLITVGDAAAVRRRLLVEHRIQVRNCASFGLPDFIRIGTRTRPDNTRLLAALERCQ
jgi:histidinol-phosphate aminotransferase